jgi:pimeloyl-ACP methyl ester carboxylesterase
MTKKAGASSADIRGFSRLAVDAATGLTDLVEAMHRNIVDGAWPSGAPLQRPTQELTGLVYGTVRGVTRVVGGGIDVLLWQLAPMLGEGGSSPQREMLLAVLNGVLGDYLAATDNPLAIPMRLRRQGQPLELSGDALAPAIPPPTSKILVLLHGSCMNDLRWERRGHDHGAALAHDLGYTPLYLHYNSGRHISVNGREFAALLETLLAAWPLPIDELAIVAHSMGGLVARSARHYAGLAGHTWPRHLRKLIFLGTPHLGAPLERGGNWIDVALGASPYTAPLARLGKIRSAGITDLRHGSLLDEDWECRDRFERSKHRPQSVPLPDDVNCYAIAGTTGKRIGDLSDRLLGDGLVPVRSALGRHKDPARALALPPSRQWIAYEMSHMDLLWRPEVYAQIKEWLAAESG